MSLPYTQWHGAVHDAGGAHEYVILLSPIIIGLHRDNYLSARKNLMIGVNLLIIISVHIFKAPLFANRTLV